MTEAGKRLLADLTVNSAGEAAFETVHPYWVAHLTAQIAAIEAEARRDLEQRLRAAVEALAGQWEREAARRIADPRAPAASLLAAGIQRSHARAVLALLAPHDATEP